MTEPLKADERWYIADLQDCPTVIRVRVSEVEEEYCRVYVMHGQPIVYLRRDSCLLHTDKRIALLTAWAALERRQQAIAVEMARLTDEIAAETAR